MYISHKSNVLQTVNEVEWQCRRLVKGQTKAEYWTWLDSVTSGDPPVVDYSGETGYTIVECTDEDVQARLSQLGDYQSSSPKTGTVYNIKWSNNKVNCEEVLDIDGKSQSPKVYVKSHLKGIILQRMLVYLQISGLMSVETETIGLVRLTIWHSQIIQSQEICKSIARSYGMYPHRVM